MDGSAQWLRSVDGAVRRYQEGGLKTLHDLGAELSHLAWSDAAPGASTIGGDKDHPSPATGSDPHLAT
jgi:hypothetical protein